MKKLQKRWEFDLCLPQLQNGSKPQSGELEVKFQLAKDTLETMVKSMYTIRDQLANVVRYYAWICPFIPSELLFVGIISC